jgi:hypothetical protein
MEIAKSVLAMERFQLIAHQHVLQAIPGLRVLKIRTVQAAKTEKVLVKWPPVEAASLAVKMNPAEAKKPHKQGRAYQSIELVSNLIHP